jgi:hypothetical protein
MIPTSTTVHTDTNPNRGECDRRRLIFGRLAAISLHAVSFSYLHLLWSLSLGN